MPRLATKKILTTVIIKTETLPVMAEHDVVKARQMVRQWASEIGLSLVDQTKIITAASELARNMVIYGGGGTMEIQSLEQYGRRGVKLVFEDKGPGIADITQALKDGFTTGSGMGLGLGGAKRLSNEFEIESTPGQGTRIMIARWK
ncbi:MAG: anti-sigma regulatory factor [Alphaproteobacteria bacterium]|nr:anti-sigma regulatory factor [Alphaproteobacteria bacterium]